jgi:acetyl esterase/lipase
MRRVPPISLIALLWAFSASQLNGVEPTELIDVWPAFAPGETTKSHGEPLPRRPQENPPATRISKITAPQMEVYPASADSACGTAVLICPGGAYNYVVRDKEGSEIAEWLNGIGVTAFVLRYRTKDGTDPMWKRPLQDAQRSLSLIRTHADEWKLDPNKLGVIGFSAGGQLAALTATNGDNRTYAAVDDIDKKACGADFAMLIYPWRLLDGDKLMKHLPVNKTTPPTFLVHSHNDGSTSLNSIQFYAALKASGVSGELHIYRSGGHGYGLRPVKGSRVHTWPARGTDWLRGSGFAHEASDAEH